MNTIQTRIIVLLADGSRLKGFSRDFHPTRESFHLILVGPQGETGEQRQVAMTNVDAVFFVRDFAFEREKRYEPEDDLAPMPRPPSVGGRGARVSTSWGEILVGLTYDYRDDEPGFFLFPTDPLNRTLNLERAYLTAHAVEGVEFTEHES